MIGDGGVALCSAKGHCTTKAAPAASRISLPGIDQARDWRDVIDDPQFADPPGHKLGGCSPQRPPASQGIGIGRGREPIMACRFMGSSAWAGRPECCILANFGGFIKRSAASGLWWWCCATPRSGTADAVPGGDRQGGHPGWT